MTKFRIYDKKKKEWLRDGIYMSPINDIYVSKKTLFCTEKLSLVSNNRYIHHTDIGLTDKNHILIFEGDICRIEELEVIGVVAYAPEIASYCLLDDKNLKYYPLGEERCKQVEVIGNVFDNSELIEEKKEG